MKRGSLRVAMITTARYFATRLIGDFCRAHPNIELRAGSGQPRPDPERMRDNLDDLYIMGLAPEEMEVDAFQSRKTRWW